MQLASAALPALSGTLVPAQVCGTAGLTGFAYQGNGHDSLMRWIDRFHTAGQPGRTEAARAYDTAIAYQLAFRRSDGLALQTAALDRCQLYRIHGAAADLRLLALVAPGDLMANVPLDFLTNALGIRLDLLYVIPGRPLPEVIPDHDLAFFAIGEAEPAERARLQALFNAWPRPALNDPRFLPVLDRQVLSGALAGIDTICSPPAVAVTRAELAARLADGSRVADFPCLIRPRGSHAGAELARVQSPAELAGYLEASTAAAFFLTRYVDYSGPDGLFRKSRVVFIDRAPFLCHLAVSEHWMVHYLNAGMTESAAKRAEEARAMAEFDDGFARRHAAAFAALHQRLGFDYYSIDCAETRDGRLLVFEADVAAIVHLMDPADLFPYKQPQMHRVFAAFGDLLRRRGGFIPAPPERRR